MHGSEHEEEKAKLVDKVIPSKFRAGIYCCTNIAETGIGNGKAGRAHLTCVH